MRILPLLEEATRSVIAASLRKFLRQIGLPARISYEEIPGLVEYLYINRNEVKPETSGVYWLDFGGSRRLLGLFALMDGELYLSPPLPAGELRKAYAGSAELATTRLYGSDFESLPWIGAGLDVGKWNRVSNRYQALERSIVIDWETLAKRISAKRLQRELGLLLQDSEWFEKFLQDAWRDGYYYANTYFSSRRDSFTYTYLPDPAGRTEIVFAFRRDGDSLLACPFQISASVRMEEAKERLLFMRTTCDEFRRFNSPEAFGKATKKLAQQVDRSRALMNRGAKEALAKELTAVGAQERNGWFEYNDIALRMDKKYAGRLVVQSSDDKKLTKFVDTVYAKPPDILVDMKSLSDNTFELVITDIEHVKPSEVWWSYSNVLRRGRDELYKVVADTLTRIK